MNEESKPNIDAFVEQIKTDQDKISKAQDSHEIFLALTQVELQSLVWHFFQPGANGGLIEDGRVTPRNFNWGNCTAQRIQAAVLGTPTLQHKIINLLAKIQKENQKRDSE